MLAFRRGRHAVAINLGQRGGRLAAARASCSWRPHPERRRRRRLGAEPSHPAGSSFASSGFSPIPKRGGRNRRPDGAEAPEERRGRSSTHPQALAFAGARRGARGGRLRLRRQRQRLRAHLVHLQRAQRRAADRRRQVHARSPAAATPSRSSSCPRDADGQREQLVRRLGAEDSSVDLIGMDVIWTGEFANAGWIDPLPAKTPRVVTDGVFASVAADRRAGWRALRGAAVVEHPVAVVPLGPGPEAAHYLGGDDRAGARTSRGPEPDPGAGQPLCRDLMVWVNSMIESAGTSILVGPDRGGALRAGPNGGGDRDDGGVRQPPSAADPRGHTSHRGHRPPRTSRPATAELHDQLPVRLSEREENAPDVFKHDRSGEVPGINPGEPVAPAARRHQPRGLHVLGQPGPDVRRDHLSGSAQEPDRSPPTLGGLPPVTEARLRHPRTRKGLSGFSDVIRESIEDAAPRPLDAGLHAPFARDPAARSTPSATSRRTTRRRCLRGAPRQGPAGREPGRPSVSGAAATDQAARRRDAPTDSPDQPSASWAGRSARRPCSRCCWSPRIRSATPSSSRCRTLDLRFPDEGGFAGLSNYETVLTSSLWWQDVFNTLFVTIISVAVERCRG